MMKRVQQMGEVGVDRGLKYHAMTLVAEYIAEVLQKFTHRCA
jgi:hypothetical protein